MKFLLLLLLVAVLRKGETARITNNDYVLLVLNKNLSCTAVVTSPVLAITPEACAKHGDDIQVCRRGADDGKNCEDGASVEVVSVFNYSPGISGIKLADAFVKPVKLNDKEVEVGTPCSVIGFGQAETDVNKETVSKTPQIFSTAIKEVREDKIELTICKGNKGSAVICENKLTGILPEKGSCMASKVKTMQTDLLIARQDETEAPAAVPPAEGEKPKAPAAGGEKAPASTEQASEEPENMAVYLKTSFMTIIFPVGTLLLLLP